MPVFNEDLLDNTPLPGAPPAPDTFTGPYQKPAQQSFFELGQAPADGQRASTYEELVKGIENKNLGITPNTPQNTLSSSTLLKNSKFPLYRPNADLEDIYGQSQSWYNKLGNSVVKFAATTIGTFAQGFATIPDTIEAINNGKFSSLSNKDGYEADIDSWQKQLENDFPNYYTKWEREHPFVSAIPFSGGATNFWGDKVIKNLGFTAGAIGSAVVQDLIVGAATGGIGELPLLSSQVGKLSLYFNRLLSGSTRAAEFINDVKTLGLSAEKTALLTNYATEKFGAAVVNKAANSFRYGLNLYGSARTEGAIEARDGYTTLKQDLINNYKETNLGAEPIGKDLADIENTAVAAMNTRFGINMALLTISDAVQFDNILKTFNFSKSAIKDVARIGRIGLSKETPLDLIEQVKAPTFAGKVWDVVRPALPNIFAEGVYEEGGQYAAQTGTANYYRNKYLSQKAHDRGEIDPKTGQVVSVKDSVGDVINSTVYGLGEQFGTQEGIENMFLGALTTMISSPISNKISEVNKKAEREALLNAANSQGITGILRNNYEDTVSSSQIVADMKQATKDNNLFAYKNLKSDLFYKFVQAGISSGRLDLKVEQLKLLKELGDADFKEKFGIENTSENKKAVAQYVDALIVKAEDIAKTTALVDSIYVNPYKLHKTPKTPAELVETAFHHKFNDYKNELSYLSSTKKDAEQRIQDIDRDVRNISPLVSGQLAANLISPEYLDGLHTEYKEQAKQLRELGDKDSIARAALYDAQASKIEKAKASKTQEDLLSMYTSLMNFELNGQDKGEDRIGIEAPSIMQQGHDINQLNSRKGAMAEAYQFLSSKEGFEQYNQQDPSDFEEETTPTENQTITLTTKKGEGKVELGVEYMLGDVEEEGPNGTTIFRHPILTILGENEDGTIKIKDGQGEIRDVSKDVLSKYRLSPAANVLNDKTANYFRLHRNTVFEYNFGKASKEGKRKGRLTHELGEDGKSKLFFNYVSNKGKKKRIQLFREHFLAQEGFKNPRIKALYDLSPQTEEQKKAQEDYVSQQQEAALAEKKDARLQIISELHEETSKRLEETNKKVVEKQEQLDKINQELESLKQKAEKTALPRTKREKALENKYPELSAASIRFSKILKTVPKAISKLSSLKEEVEEEISFLLAEQEELEFNLSYIEDFGQNLEELPQDSNEFLKEIKEQVEWTKELIKETASSLSTLGRILEGIQGAIKELVQFLKGAFQKFDQDYPSYLKDGFDRIIAGGSLVAEIPLIKEYIADYTLLEDTQKEIKINEYKLEEAQRKFDSLISDMELLGKELSAKKAILDKFQKVVDQFKAKEEAEQAALKDVALQTQFFNKQKKIQLDSGIATPSPEEQQAEETSSIEKRESARKPIAYLFNSTTTPSILKRASDIVHQRFLSRLDFFPNRNNIKRTYVTENNEIALGLSGLLQKHLGEDFEKYRGDAILAIYVETSPEGQFFVNEKGERVGKIGEEVNQEELVYTAMPTSSLEDSYGKRYAGEDEEEAKAWQKAWEQKRQELLSYTKEYLAPEEFFVSRGVVSKTHRSKNKEYIIGTLVSEQQLKNNVPVIVVSTTGQIEHQGKKINIPAGRVMIQNGSFLEYANNRNLTEKEAQASFNVLKEFVRKANEEKTFDPKLLKFLQGILYFQSPYVTEEEKQTKNPVARNQFYFHQGNLFLGELEFPIPFTSVSLDVNKERVMAFLRGSYNHINNKLLTDPILSSQPFIEYINNLEEKEWPNYQTYLLSKEGRSPEEVPLSTSIRPINPLIEGDRNFKNKYSYNSTLLKVEDVNYQKPEQEEEVLLEKTEEQDISGMTEWDKFMAYAKKESATPKEEKAAPSGFKITDFTNEGPEEGQQKGGGKNVLLSDIFGAEQGTDEFQKLLDEQAGKNTSDDESQFRIAIPSYNYTLAKVEEEKAYIEKNSPFSVQTVKNLVSSANGIALWGAYKNAIILLDEAMEEGTGYHELFEGIFDVFLNNAEKKRIYKEFISRKGAFIDRPTGILTEYSLATTQQAKEQMAEEFRDFKLYGEMPSEIESATSPIIKFFQDLLKWIKSIFTGEINSLDTLFSRMDSAYYKNAAFKNAPTQILQAREKIGDFDAIETDTVVRAVVSSVFQNLFQEGNTKLINDLDFREKVPVEIYNKIKEQLQYYYLSRKDQEGKILPNTAYKELKEQGLSDANINNVLKPIALSLFKNWDQVVRYSGELLKTFKILQEADVVDKEGEETEIEGRDSYWKEAFEWDGKKNAPASVKLLIATLQESAFIATSGTIVPGEAPSMKKVTVIRDPSTRMQKMVDYAKTFNSLLDQLANINTLEGKEVKIRELADLHPEYVRLFTRLRAASEKPSLQDWFLRIKFYNTFAKQHPLALNTYLRPDGTSSIGAADLDSSLKQLSNNWLSMLKASPAAIYKEGKYFLNVEYKEKGKLLFYPGIATPSDRLKYLASIGIKFSPQQVNNLTKEQEKALSTAISSLRTQLKGTKVDISSLYSLRANTPLEAIFKIFLQTQNLVPNSVFADLSGNYRQSFVQTNAISRMANDLNNSSTKQELFQELPNLQDEYSSDSYYLSSLYNEEGQRQGHEFRIKYIQGIVAPDGQRNTPTEKLSRSKKLLQAINQNLNENYYLLIPADGKTEWMMGMKNPFLSLSDAALSQFYKYYQNEQGLGGSSDRIFSFLKDHLSEEEFNKQLSQFVEDEVAKQFKELKDYNIITNVPGGKFNWEGLDASYIEANKLNHKKLSAEDVHNILVYRTVNFAFNNIEMHKLFFGDPAKYTDFKRYKSFLSPREQALYNSPKFDAKANEEYNQVNGQELKKGDPGYQRYRDALKTVTQEDVISLNELPEYSAINGTDAQGFSHPAAYKQMRIKTARWNSLDEEQIQFIHAEDRILMEEDGLYKYSSQILKKHDQKLLANKDPHTSRFSPLKPIVAGHEADGPILDKYSIAMLSYRMVRGTNLARQYKRMLDNEIDYTIYKSGRKVGAKGLDSIYNADGSPNTAPYNKEAIINIPFKWWGIQVETQGDKFSQTWGSQLGKLATMNLLDGGVPIDYKGSFQEWLSLSSEKEREEASPIYKLVAHERSIREAMIEVGYQSLLHKIGINKDGTISKKKLLKTIKDELTRRELNDNIKDALKLTDDGEFYIPLEALNNYEQIKNIIFSYIDKNISRPKVGGGSKIQVSSSGIEAAGHRIIAHTKKGKTTYTSAGLKFYTKEEPWMEIMVGNWFADKIRRIPALNGLSDEEILKRINDGPDGKEILSGIGFRIPTQELNSVENFRIKAFLPDYLGDMVVVPEALTKKSGGDFDVDKLNTYLKNVYVNGKGQLAIIPFQGIGEDGLEAFRELVTKETFQKLISITPLDKFKAKTQPEEGEEETEEGIQANIEALNTGELVPDALEDAKDAEDLAQKMYRQSLENEYYKTVGELLSLPENFDHLVSPNNSDELMALRDRLSSLVPEEFGQGLNKTILSPTFMNTLRHMYAEGKGGVGIAASAQVQNALAQKTPIVIDPQKISQLKDKNEKTYIGNASILLPHNSVQAGGKTFPTISKIKDQAGRYISTKISQFINGFVDIANDPFLVQIGVNNNNAGTFLLLERLGVPTEVTILFMNQPIIREYQKSLDKIGMSYPYIKDNVDAILSNSKFKADKNKVPKQFPSLKTKELSVYLEDNIDKFYNGELTKEQREFQHFVLGEYLKYSVIAQNLFRLSQATNYDTARFTNPYLYLRKLVKTKDARTNNIFSSPDAILSSTFVGLLGDKVGEATKKIADAFFQFLHSDIQPYVFPIIYKLAERKKMNDQEFIKAARKVEQSFISYLIQNTTGLNTRIKELLVDEETSLAHSLQQMKAKIESLPHNPFPIISRFIAENMSSPEATKSIRMFDKGTDVFSQNTLIAAMQELKANPATSELYGKIARVAFLQSGIAQTPTSFIDIIPVEDFKAFVLPAIKNLYNTDLLRGFQQTRSFYKNSWRDPNIVPRLPLKFSNREEDMIFDPNFGDFVRDLNTPTNRYKNTSLEQYSKQKGINNFVVFKVSERSNQYSSDYISVQMGDKNKKTYLLQKLIDPITGEPFTQPYPNEEKYGRYAIYYQINPLGDGYKAQEHYRDNRRSILETEAASIPVELSPTEILSAIRRKNLIIPENVALQKAPIKGQIDFQEDQNPGYAARTRKNASADATIAIAVDFTSAGEKLTKSSVEGQKKKYIPIDIKGGLDPAIVTDIVEQLNSVNAQSLNIAGNGIYTMKGAYTQEQLDDLVYRLLETVLPKLNTPITSIRTGGQTGIDEAGAKAGLRLGIPTTILAPKGWAFRDITGKDIYNQAKFKARFEIPSSFEDFKNSLDSKCD